MQHFRFCPPLVRLFVGLGLIPVGSFLIPIARFLNALPASDGAAALIYGVSRLHRSLLFGEVLPESDWESVVRAHAVEGSRGFRRSARVPRGGVSSGTRARATVNVVRSGAQGPPGPLGFGAPLQAAADLT